MPIAVTRRALSAGAASAVALTFAPPAAARRSDPLLAYDAVGLAGLIRRREVTAREALDAAVARAERLDGRLGAIVTTAYQRAHDQLKAAAPTGPFAGVPMLIKDLTDVKGLPTLSGSRATGDPPPAARQGPYVDALERAGFVIYGKSQTPEYGFLPTTEPLRGPVTRNPWNLDRSAGGSSGGAAAAVAAGLLPAAHATDGGGSIRIPAAACGLVGLKPSRGRMIAPGVTRQVTDLSAGHMVTRTVRDCAAIFAATEFPAGQGAYEPVGLVTGPSRRRLRVGVMINTGGGAPPRDEVADAVARTAALLRALRHDVRPTALPFDGRAFGDAFSILWATGAKRLVDQVGKGLGRPADTTVLEPFTLAMARLVEGLPAGAADQAVRTLEDAAARYAAWLGEFDVILSPVLAAPAAPLGYVAGDVPFEELQRRLFVYVGYTPVHNVAGAPAISLPLAWSADGLPIGMHFAAKAGDERTLYELAYELERAAPWAGRRPAYSAWRA